MTKATEQPTARQVAGATSTPRAVIYARVGSGAGHPNTALEYQLELCKQWARKHEVAVDSVHQDVGASAATLHRDGLLAALLLAEQQGVEYLVAARPETVSRRLSDLQLIYDKLDQAHCKLRFVDWGEDDEARLRLMANIVTAAAEFEASSRREDERRGREAAAKRRENGAHDGRA